MKSDRLLFSCEHAKNFVPARFRDSLQGPRAQAALDSHRGYDPGALWLAREFEKCFGAPLWAGTISRLLIELNRSENHPRLFSEFSSLLSPPEKRMLLDEYYLPHRGALRSAIATEVRRGRRAVHIAVHSFTPRLAGRTRTADVGFLYDPQRAEEKGLCLCWKAQLEAALPDLRVRRNYPYLGKEDGLTTALRREFSGHEYLGIELEVNQALLLGGGVKRKRLADALLAGLRAVVSPCLASRSRMR